MNKPSEKQLEIFLINPGDLSNEEFEMVIRAIQHDEEIRLIADWLRRFYYLLEEYVEGGRQLFLEKEEIPSIIDLEPLQSIKKNGRREFVLAAQTDGTKNSRIIEQVRTFSSREYSTLVRVLSLKSKKMTRIDVISDLIADDDIVLLSTPGSEISLVTEPGGKIEISSTEITREDVKAWQSCRVKLPVLKSKANPKSSERNGYILAKSSTTELESIEVIQKEKYVEIHTDQKDKKNRLNYLVLSEADTVSTLWKLANGKAIIPKSKFQNKEVTLFFYS